METFRNWIWPFVSSVLLAILIMIVKLVIIEYLPLVEENKELRAKIVHLEQNFVDVECPNYHFRVYGSNMRVKVTPVTYWFSDHDGKKNLFTMHHDTREFLGKSLVNIRCDIRGYTLTTWVSARDGQTYERWIPLPEGSVHDRSFEEMVFKNTEGLPLEQ